MIYMKETEVKYSIIIHYLRYALLILKYISCTINSGYKLQLHLQRFMIMSSLTKKEEEEEDYTTYKRMGLIFQTMSTIVVVVVLLLFFQHLLNGRLNLFIRRR